MAEPTLEDQTITSSKPNTQVCPLVCSTGLAQTGRTGQGLDQSEGGLAQSS